jgi:hypothetical protein
MSVELRAPPAGGLGRLPGCFLTIEPRRLCCVNTLRSRSVYVVGGELSAVSSEQSVHAAVLVGLGLLGYLGGAVVLAKWLARRLWLVARRAFRARSRKAPHARVRLARP